MQVLATPALAWRSVRPSAAVPCCCAAAARDGATASRASGTPGFSQSGRLEAALSELDSLLALRTAALPAYAAHAREAKQLKAQLRQRANEFTRGFIGAHAAGQPPGLLAAEIVAGSRRARQPLPPPAAAAARLHSLELAYERLHPFTHVASAAPFLAALAAEQRDAARLPTPAARRRQALVASRLAVRICTDLAQQLQRSAGRDGAPQDARRSNADGSSSSAADFTADAATAASALAALAGLPRSAETLACAVALVQEAVLPVLPALPPGDTLRLLGALAQLQDGGSAPIRPCMVEQRPDAGRRGAAQRARRIAARWGRHALPTAASGTAAFEAVQLQLQLPEAAISALLRRCGALLPALAAPQAAALLRSLERLSWPLDDRLAAQAYAHVQRNLQPEALCGGPPSNFNGAAAGGGRSAADEEGATSGGPGRPGEWHPGCYSPGELSDALQCLAAAESAAPTGFWPALFRATQPALFLYPPAALARLLAVVVASCPPADVPPAWASEALAQLQPRLAALDGAPLVHLLQCCVTLGITPPEDWVSCYQRAARRLLLYWPPPLLTASLWSLARLGFLPSASWLRGYMRASGRRLRQYSAVCLTRTALAFALLRWRPPPAWLAAFLRTAGEQLVAGCFSAAQVTHLTWALAELGARPPAATFAALLAVLAPSVRTAAEPQTLARLLASIEQLASRAPAGHGLHAEVDAFLVAGYARYNKLQPRPRAGKRGGSSSCGCTTSNEGSAALPAGERTTRYLRRRRQTALNCYENCNW